MKVQFTPVEPVICFSEARHESPPPGRETVGVGATPESRGVSGQPARAVKGKMLAARPGAGDGRLNACEGT